MLALSLFTLIVAIALCVFIARNYQVRSVRIAFIHQPGDWRSRYEALPSYDAMLLHPRFWLLWTFAHWTAWVDRKQSEATR